MAHLGQTLINIDINLRVRQMNRIAIYSARFDGEIRLLSACAVDKGEAIVEDSSRDGVLTVKYCRARVDGRLLALRYFHTARRPPNGDDDCNSGPEPEDLVARATGEDRILAEIS